MLACGLFSLRREACRWPKMTDGCSARHGGPASPAAPCADLHLAARAPRCRYDPYSPRRRPRRRADRMGRIRRGRCQTQDDIRVRREKSPIRCRSCGLRLAIRPGAAHGAKPRPSLASFQGASGVPLAPASLVLLPGPAPGLRRRPQVNGRRPYRSSPYAERSYSRRCRANRPSSQG